MNRTVDGRDLSNRHYHQMSGELALRLIRSIRTNTESTVINELFQNQSHSSLTSPSTSTNGSTSKSTTIAEEIDIVPYKSLCPYSTSSTDTALKNHLKKLTKFVKNIPCDRPCPVNLYRHLRNYHKVDLQHAKDITRTIMASKTIKSEDIPDISNPSRKRMKLSGKKTTDHESTVPLIHMDLNGIKTEEKSRRDRLKKIWREDLFLFR